MTLSLYNSTVPAFQQSIAATIKLLGKAEAFAAERGVDPATLVTARLAPDMNDFAYQIKSVAVHSMGAIEGVRAGQFSPDHNVPPPDFAALRARLHETRDALAAIEPGEIDGFVGRDISFVFRTGRTEYLAEDFLLSFSLPNFYFHATTAYAILRAAGLPIGKVDYLGRPRFRA